MGGVRDREAVRYASSEGESGLGCVLGGMLWLLGEELAGVGVKLDVCLAVRLRP